jgi:DNA topoisomerase I
VYRDARGRRVSAAATLERIRRLAIPPAWTDVWICPDEDGHLQATGRDARRRKQYRYHPDWTAVRDAAKFDRVLAFARALPAIRRTVRRDLRRPPLSRERVLATVVRLLESTLIRVGNEEYARENQSFGLTTLRNRHVRIRGGRLVFRFRAKAGVMQSITLADPVLARAVRQCQDLPGQVLFQYVDDTGERRRVDSADVNAYLRESAGDDFTAKDFRTWAGTVLAACALREISDVDEGVARKQHIVRAVETVASRLGNTRAVCRRCYVHPAVFDAYLDGTTVEVVAARADQLLNVGLTKLSAAETAVLSLLRRYLARSARGTRTSSTRAAA